MSSAASAGHPPKPLRRRHLLGLLAAVPATAHAAPASPAPAFPDGATLLAAGPQGGSTDRWADWLAPLLAHDLPPSARLRRETVGGADGVTGANQFDARITPDGATALLLPGQAALAWLLGDPRAQFDAAHWVPALAGIGSGVVMARLPGGAGSGMRLRIGAAGPGGPDLPALLGLEFCGIEFVPVFGLADANAAENALAQGAIDAAFAHGRRVPDQVAAFTRAGAAPLFALGTVDETGQPARDPQFPDLPIMPEIATRQRGAAPAGTLYDAWRASAAATQLDAGLVLPQLTPAAMVALWRRACRDAAASPELEATVTPLGLRAVPSPLATACTAAIAANGAALLELRRWLATRFNWHPT